ncbi:MAG: DUF6502 family protein [Pseudomonadota bacterium]
MGSAIHEAVLQACRNFMIPIARFLLRNGVTFKEFAEISKWAFVKVAADDYGAGERKASVSRISVATGLSRKEVARFVEFNPPAPTYEAEWRLASATLQTWHTDPEYLDESGEPVPLSVADNGEGFNALVASATGDCTNSNTVLGLLLEADSVARVGEGVVVPTIRYFMPGDSECHAAHHFGEAIGNLANTIQNNYNKRRVATYFERFVWTDSLPKLSGVRFQRLLGDQASKMLEMLDDWLTAHEVPEPTGRKVGVGVFYFETPDSENSAHDATP